MSEKKSFMQTLKSWSQAAWNWITCIWKKANVLADKVCPVAISIVDKMKDINSSTEGDAVASVVKAAIPGKKDDIIIDGVRRWLTFMLPKIAIELKIVDSIRGIKDPSEQLKAICNAINISSDSYKNATYHTLATMIINDLSDGKITWAESIALAEFYYQNEKAFSK